MEPCQSFVQSGDEEEVMGAALAAQPVQGIEERASDLIQAEPIGQAVEGIRRALRAEQQGPCGAAGIPPGQERRQRLEAAAEALHERIVRVGESPIQVEAQRADSVVIEPRAHRIDAGKGIA
jgi:hypothetical protein